MIKKILKTIGIIVLVAIVGINVYVVVSGKTYFYKAIRYNFAGVDDYQLFENRVLHMSTQPQPWLISKNFNKKPLSEKLQHKLDSLQTFAFLVIKNDSVVYESYSDGYSSSSFSNSFSMAKTVVSMLIGAAITEGKIKNIDQAVGDFLPDFNSEGKEKITIKHLLTMSSGLNWDESYASPFSMTTEAYYGSDLTKLMSNLKAIEEPGKEFKYLSGNTQIMAMVLEKATGKHLAEYAEEKLWQPMGAENDALWSLDKNDGTEKAYCCLNSNARDFARLGKLYLQKGNWNGTQIIDSNYVTESLKPADIINPTDGKPVDFYGLQWWLMPNVSNTKAFYARGILGQCIIVVPEYDFVIVRLGYKRGTKIGEHQSEVFTYIEETIKLF
jgi:CubicO group peptidase (beta-lactamase class C family)